MPVVHRHEVRGGKCRFCHCPICPECGLGSEAGVVKLKNGKIRHSKCNKNGKPVR